MRDKRDKEDKPKLDALDLQIIAVRKDNPRATIREIADKTDIPKSTVWQRLCKIGESDWIIDARNEALALLPAAIAVYALSLGEKENRLSAARDLLNGLGILRKRHELSGPDGGPIQTTSAVVILPDDGSDPDFKPPEPNAEGAVPPSVDPPVEVPGE